MPGRRGPALQQLALLVMIEAAPIEPQLPKVLKSAQEAADPAVRWFSNELDLPCAPGWGGFLCNEKELPEGWVPTRLPSVEQAVRLNPVRAARPPLRSPPPLHTHPAPLCAQTAMDLVRLNAVQPALVPPLASGFKVVDLEKDLAGRLMQFQRDALVRVGGVPQSLGAPDRRSRIISTDPDHVFHSRVVQLPGTLKNMITATFERLISEWIGQPVVYSAGFGARTYLRNATFAAHVDRYDTHVASAIIQVRRPPTPVRPPLAQNICTNALGVRCVAVGSAGGAGLAGGDLRPRGAGPLRRSEGGAGAALRVGAVAALPPAPAAGRLLHQLLHTLPPKALGGILEGASPVPDSSRPAARAQGTVTTSSDTGAEAVRMCGGRRKRWTLGCRERSERGRRAKWRP